MSVKYDVFLSHNSADKPAVELIANRLQVDAGLKPFLDKWHLVPGESWQEALEDALQESATVAVFIGPSGVSPWHNAEMRTAIDRAVSTRDEYRLIPVLLPNADPESISSFLAQRTWVDFRPGLDDQEAFERLVAGIKGEAIRSGTYELPDEPAPYRGLLRFEAEQADFFFGREADTDYLLDKIEHNPFVAVIGASGSGKSSLVRAGLLPALAKDAIKGSKTWQTRLIVPGTDPLGSLAVGLCASLPLSDRREMVSQVKDSMLVGADGLRSETATLFATEDGRTTPLLLVIDQFEEIFTQCKEPVESCRPVIDAFIANLADAADHSNGRIRIVITLRADFLDRCLELPALKDLLQNQQMLLGPLTHDALREAIIRPAQVVGAYFEKGLVSAILRDVERNPGALPLLQVALDDLWQSRRGPWLTLEAYERSGGVQGALQRRAQTTYESLTATQQQIARNIFLRMTALGEGVSDTRRRVEIDELYLAGVAKSDIDRVLETLSGPQARLIVTGEITAEVAHEALINGWPTLRDWLETDREGLRIHRALTQDAEEWDHLEKDPGALYRGTRLANALDWSKEHAESLNPLEIEFLTASQEVVHRENEQSNRLVRARRVQIALVGAAVILVAGLVVVLLAANGFFAPRQMSGIFNLAVADFGEITSNGEIETSKTGQQISEWTVNYLRETLGNDPNVEIWPNQGGLFNRTRVGLVSPAEAQQVAEALQASLIFYGTIDPNDSPAQLELGFRILPQFGYTFDDIQGSYSPGAPIRIVDMDNPGPSVQAELEKQSSLVAYLAIGLTQVQLGQSEAALEAFEKAAETDTHSAIAHFFIGRENLFLSDRYPDQRTAYQQAAEDAFKKAIEVDQDYARASIGLGSVYMNRAADLVNSALQSDQPVDSQALLWANQAVQSYQHVLDMNPASEQYGNPVTQVAMMGLGNAYRLTGDIAAFQEDIPAAQTAFEKSVESLEDARSFFENAVNSNPSLQRYLVQTYEYLGKTHQLQGYIFELMFDYPNASNAYQQALDYFLACVEQSESTSDLIIQDEIIGLYCQPYAEETQTRIETLSGGQG